MHDVQGRDTNEVLDAQTSVRLSQRLRMARQMRGMTLKVLANAAGCSESLLSKIENAKAFPSLPMLHRLVQSLDIDMGWMFAARDREAVVFRAGNRPMVAFASSQDAIWLERVIPDPEKHLLQCNILHIDAGGESSATNRHVGEETGYLLEGQLELIVDGETHQLAAGDAFAFRSDQPHGFRNTGPGRTSVFWVVSPPAAA